MQILSFQPDIAERMLEAYGRRVGQRKRTIRPYGQRLLDCVA